MDRMQRAPLQISKLLAEVPSYATGVLIVRVAAICGNYRLLRQLAPQAETAAVVKADAYGLGAEAIVPALEKEGCRTFFVATLREAETVRSVSPKAAIYVLDGLLPGTASQFDAMSARPVLSSLAEVAEWASFCRRIGRRLPAAIHFDTGLNRLGIPSEEMQALAEDPENLQRFDLQLIMSHLACADESQNGMNQAQKAKFTMVAGAFPGVRRSLANSAGIFLGAGFHFDLTRPGIALYGGRARTAGVNPCEPAAFLFGRIAQVHWAKRGATVGYVADKTLKRRTRIATVCAGYADGYFRSLSASDGREGPKGYACGHALPLLGRVSMDLITFDATDTPEDLVTRGGWIELLGSKVSADDLAARAGTIGYEVLTSLGRRYLRMYVDD